MSIIAKKYIHDQIWNYNTLIYFNTSKYYNFYTIYLTNNQNFDILLQKNKTIQFSYNKNIYT